MNWYFNFVAVVLLEIFKNINSCGLKDQGKSRKLPRPHTPKPNKTRAHDYESRINTRSRRIEPCIYVGIPLPFRLETTQNQYGKHIDIYLQHNCH